MRSVLKPREDVQRVEKVTLSNAVSVNTSTPLDHGCLIATTATSYVGHTFVRGRAVGASSSFLCIVLHFCSS